MRVHSMYTTRNEVLRSRVISNTSVNVARLIRNYRNGVTGWIAFPHKECSWFSLTCKALNTLGIPYVLRVRNKRVRHFKSIQSVWEIKFK